MQSLASQWAANGWLFGCCKTDIGQSLNGQLLSGHWAVVRWFWALISQTLGSYRVVFCQLLSGCQAVFGVVIIRWLSGINKISSVSCCALGFQWLSGCLKTVRQWSNSGQAFF